MLMVKSAAGKQEQDSESRELSSTDSSPPSSSPPSSSPPNSSPPISKKPSEKNLGSAQKSTFSKFSAFVGHFKSNKPKKDAIKERGLVIQNQVSDDLKALETKNLKIITKILENNAEDQTLVEEGTDEELLSSALLEKDVITILTKITAQGFMALNSDGLMILTPEDFSTLNSVLLQPRLALLNSSEFRDFIEKTEVKCNQIINQQISTAFVSGRC